MTNLIAQYSTSKRILYTHSIVCVLLLFTLFLVGCTTDTFDSEAMSEVEMRMAEAQRIDFPRCGNLETAAFNELIQVHDDLDTIRYAIPYIPESLDADTVRNAIATAYQQWSDIINIPILEVQISTAEHITEVHNADIVVTFDWLDGIGGILGKAEFPKTKTPQTLVFDLYDMHEIDGEINFCFFTTALHEAGHTLGIPHLHNAEAVMWPAYRIAHQHPAYPDILEAKTRYDIRESFQDQGGRKFVYIKKKTIPDSTPISEGRSFSADVEISKERDISSTAHSSRPLSYFASFTDNQYRYSAPTGTLNAMHE